MCLEAVPSLSTIDWLCSRQKRFVWASVRSCQPEWRYKVSNPPPQSNTLKINSTHEKNTKMIWPLKKTVVNCCLMGAGWPLNLTYRPVHDMSFVFNSILPPPSRWRYVYVWISQWIYSNRLSGPVCQACDPGSGQLSWWATWASVISPVTCFKMMEWQKQQETDAAAKRNPTVKMMWRMTRRK